MTAVEIRSCIYFVIFVEKNGQEKKAFLSANNIINNRVYYCSHTYFVSIKKKFKLIS